MIPEELTPPMQSTPGSSIYSPNEAGPFYRFALARRSEENVLVCTSHPLLSDVVDNGEEDDDGETYIENVIQTYAVQIPYAEQVDGETVTQFRTEHRTRTVPIRRKRKKAGDTDTALVEQTYTISVPYTELVDGIAYTRSRLETRTRMAPEDEVPRTLIAAPDSSQHLIADVEFYDLHRSRLDAEPLLDGPDDYLPVILIASPDHIVPYFSSVLKPETTFLVIPSACKQE